mgnify:CR=1 FL=1
MVNDLKETILTYSSPMLWSASWNFALKHCFNTVNNVGLVLCGSILNIVDNSRFFADGLSKLGLSHVGLQPIFTYSLSANMRDSLKLDLLIVINMVVKISDGTCLII